jgi:excisionase family DNA binding protein
MPKIQTPPRPSTPDASNSAARRRRYVKIVEAADYLAVTDRTIRQMIADGRLTAYRSGSRLVRLDLDEVDAAMVAFGGSVA